MFPSYVPVSLMNSSISAKCVYMHMTFLQLSLAVTFHPYAWIPLYANVPSLSVEMPAALGKVMFPANLEKVCSSSPFPPGSLPEITN